MANGFVGMRRFARIGAVCFVFAAIAASTANADWPDFGGGPGQDRSSSFYPGLSVGRLWSGPAAANASGCVVESSGYVFTVVANLLDSSAGSLYAFNESTGSIAWQTPSFPIAQSCPAVDGSHVYVGEGYSSSHTPSVNAYNVSDGSPAWSYSFSGNNGGDTAGPPTVDGSTVYVAGYGDTCGAASGCVFAFNASTGSQLWAALLSTQADAAPVAVGSAVLELQRSPTPGLVAMASTSGATLWSDGSAFTSPVADGTNVIYSTQPTGPENQGAALYSRVASSGAENWSTALPTGAIPQGMAADGTRVFVLISSYNSGLLQVLAYDENEGTLLWDVPLSSSTSSLIGAFGGRLYTTTDVLDSSSGNIVGTSPYGSVDSLGSAYDQGTLFSWEPSLSGAGEQLAALRDISPPAVSLAAPADNVATSSTQPTFSWAASDGNGSGISHIDFLLDGAQVGADLPATATSFVPATALPDGNYTWQVSAVDNVGNATTTQARTLSIDTHPPTTPALTGPANGAVTNTAHPTLSWDASSDATSGVSGYLLSIDNGPVQSVPLSGCQGAACTYTEPSQLADGVHTWSLSAVDRAGNVSTAAVGSFAVAVSPTAVISAPSIVLAGQAITLSAASSTDANSTLNDFAWDFDGSATYNDDAMGASSVSHTFATSGEYVVDLRVRDSAGLVATAERTINVVPAPPAGAVGVSIDAGAYATNDPKVQVDLVWPSGATQVVISNDGGFGQSGGTQTMPLAPTVSWTLEKTGVDRLPKTVYVRFLGAGIDLDTFTDDIVLDEAPPQIVAAQLESPGTTVSNTASAASVRRYSIKLSAKDTVVGICELETSAKRAASGSVTTLRSCREKGLTRLERTVRVSAAARPRYIRVRNSAGTWSNWRPLRLEPAPNRRAETPAARGRSVARLSRNSSA